MLDFPAVRRLNHEGREDSVPRLGPAREDPAVRFARTTRCERGTDARDFDLRERTRTLIRGARARLLQALLQN